MTNVDDLSPGLHALDAMDAGGQAAFWRSCVGQKQPELEALGGLPLDCVMNDVLTRYFDSSCRSVFRVFDQACLSQQEQNTKGMMHKDGLYIALSEFYGMFDTSAEERQNILNGSNEQFERICETVTLPCNQDCFAYAVRRMRMAILLLQFDLDGGIHTSFHKGHIYHMDYDNENMWTPFNYSTTTKQHSYSQKTFTLPVIEEQSPHEDYFEYLFGKRQRSGNVHWAHVHQPDVELILAMGQVWRLPGPELSMLASMEHTQSQVSLYDKTAPPDTKGYSWSSLIIPALCLDKGARESLQRYRMWKLNRRDPKRKHTITAEPPRVHVATTNANLAMMWTHEEASSLLTVSTESSYIGKWNTDTTSHEQSFLNSFLAEVTCAGGGCCADDDVVDNRHVVDNRPDEGKPLLGHEGDLEKGVEVTHGAAKRGLQKPSPLLKKILRQECEEDVQNQLATDPTTSTITFEDCFEKVLLSLEQRNSVLRLGNHWDLFMRICANQTFEYLDVLDLYQAAITRLTYLLRGSKTSNKGNLIAKIEQVKLELSNVEMLVKPFAIGVVDKLAEMVEELKGHPRLHHQMKNVQNNARSFLPKCQSLQDSCDTLTVEYDRKGSDKMNNILNILTFITFVITPMQLMTGIYGMNWEHMPELSWIYGYHYFWSLSVVLSIVFALILVCLQRDD